MSQLKGQTLQNESAKRQTLQVLQISLCAWYLLLIGKNDKEFFKLRTFEWYISLIGLSKSQNIMIIIEMGEMLEMGQFHSNFHQYILQPLLDFHRYSFLETRA